MPNPVAITLRSATLRTVLRRSSYSLALLGAAWLATALLLLPSSALASGAATPSVKPQKAKLRKGRAIPPVGAPAEVKRLIRAANRIRNKPYRWGGGHRRWRDRGYDCSGAVSYALHGAGLLRRPKSSGGLMRWGRRGKGRWITVYANRSHTYLRVAGLRFDTANTRGDGPGWSRNQRSIAGSFKKRHPLGL